MEVLITLILLFILGTQIFLVYLILNIEKWLAILSTIDIPEEEEAKTTDPFTKPKEIYQSSQHIIVPKTPTEIRNQNFKKIKEGVEYGDIKE